jgi:uracil-DNA glycosylase
MKYKFSPEGPSDAQIAVVCEKPHKEEIAKNRILVGPTGQAVRDHLAKAGLHAGNTTTLSKEVFLTNAVQSFNEIGNPTPSEALGVEQVRLLRELDALPDLKVVIPMGNVAFMSLSNMHYSRVLDKDGKPTGIGKWRGSKLKSVLPGVLMVPTYHPSFYFQGNWKFKPIVQFDINRAVKEIKCPTNCLQTKSLPTTYCPIHHSNTSKVWNVAPTFPDLMNWKQLILNSPSEFLSFDIETKLARNGTWYISCIAFATTPMEAYCIPLMKSDRKPYWPDLSTESLVWRAIREILNQPNRKYVTQNGTFDVWQLIRHGIPCNYMQHGFDTYSAHSLLAPDLPHSLDFIVSIYTDEQYYKDQSGRGEAGGYGSVGDEKFWVYNCKDAANTLEAAIAMMNDMREL